MFYLSCKPAATFNLLAKQISLRSTAHASKAHCASKHLGRRARQRNDDADLGADAEATGVQSVVKVHSVQSKIKPDMPWRRMVPTESVGSGFLIKQADKLCILTNAHVVADASYVQVGKADEAYMYAAHRRKISHECDLAILTLAEEAILDDMIPLSLGKLPQLQDEVSVVGYPKGGEGISVTVGVVSRIEVQEYGHSGAELLAIQVDAAINSGNSGGPVLDRDGRVIGVAFQDLEDSQNIGYVIPVPIIEHFLADTDPQSDGTQCQGFCSLGIVWQELKNKQLRNYLGVWDDRNAGILLSGILPLSPACDFLQRGDVLLALDGHRIANDGSFSLNGRQRLSFEHIVHLKFPGDLLPVMVLRSGTVVEFNVPVQPMRALVPVNVYDEPQPYFLYAGFAFIKLTQPFLEAWGDEWESDAPRDLVHLAFRGVRESSEEEPVVLAYSFASLRAGYTSHSLENRQVVSVNGILVVNLRQMHRLVQSLHRSSDYIVFELFRSGGNAIVTINTAEADQTLAETMQLYSIPAASSPELCERPDE